MADYIAIPPAKEVRGTVSAPPSKSATNRALVLAALSETEVEIESPLVSEDTRALVRCLTAMGASIAPSPLGLRVRGPLAAPPASRSSWTPANRGPPRGFWRPWRRRRPGGSS